MTAIVVLIYFLSIRCIFADRAFSCFNSMARPRKKRNLFAVSAFSTSEL